MMNQQMPTHRRASLSPSPQPKKTPSPSPKVRQSPRLSDGARPLADINNTTASTPPANTSNGDTSVDTSASACLTPLSPVYLMYTKQQQKQKGGMFTIRPAFPKNAKENKPTSKGNLLSSSFTHSFAYDSSSEDSSSVSASETSSTQATPHKQTTNAAISHSLLQEYFPSPSSRASDAASEDSTLVSALLSPHSSSADGDSTLEEFSSVEPTPVKGDMVKEALNISQPTLTGTSIQAQDPTPQPTPDKPSPNKISPTKMPATSEQESPSTPTGASLDLKYSASNDATGTSLDLKYSTSNVTESTAHTPEIFRHVPPDESTPVIRNTTRYPSPSNNSDMMNTAMAPPNNNNDNKVIDWAVPRPSDERVSPSMSLPSMLGGSIFEVSDLESPSLFAQTMTSEGSSDIHSQSIVDENTEILSMGGLDNHIPTPSVMTGRPPRSMRGLSTPELWSHARQHSTAHRGLQTAPASLAMKNGKRRFFGASAPTPSPRFKTDEELDRKRKLRGRPITPVTLGSLLQDTVELQDETIEDIFADTSGSQDDEKEKSSDDSSDEDEIAPRDGPIDDGELSNKTDEEEEAWGRKYCRRAAIALVILLVLLILLNAVLIPLATRSNAIEDHETDAPSNVPRMPAQAPVAGPMVAPTIGPQATSPTTSGPPSLPTPTVSPTSAPGTRPTTPGGSPVARPSIDNRPTTPGGSPVARPSVGDPPTEPPAWTAVLQGEEFWTDIGVQVKLQWHQTYGRALELEVLNALEGAYYGYLNTSISDWNATSSMNLQVRAVEQDAACQPESGKIKICNAYYGETGWAGQGQLYLRGRFIAAATIQMNDFQFFHPDHIQYQLCHLLGHALGLYHETGGCLVADVSDIEGDANLHPDAESLSYLEELYGSRRRQLRRHEAKGTAETMATGDLEMISFYVA